MATYCTTLLIKENKMLSDAEILKLLELDKSATRYDKHKIGKENAGYEYAVSNANHEQVFVTSFEQFTVIVSHLLIQDYSGSIGLLQNRVAKNFPESEFFLFFSETVSMLSGFVYGIGNHIIRKKYVQDGRYVDVYDHEMDIGELLIEEKVIYNKPHEFINGYPIKNTSYMYGSSDFSIALSFIERQFNIKNIDNILHSLTFNKNILSELSIEYIDNVNAKLISSDVESETMNTLKPLMKELKLKKIDFKKDSQRRKSKGFYKKLNENNKIVIELSFFSVQGVNQVDVIISIEQNDEKSTNLLSNNVARCWFGTSFFKIDSRIIMSKIPHKDIAAIMSRQDLIFFINELNDEMPIIRNLIKDAENKKNEDFFDDELYFNQCLEVIKENSTLIKRLTSNERLNYCLQYHNLNNSQDIANKILKIIDFDCFDEKFKDIHNRTVNRAKEIIKKNLQR